MKFEIDCFENFPDDSICPICGLSKNSPCVLIPLAGTSEGGFIKGEPVHMDCLLNFRRYIYYKELGFIGRGCLKSRQE